MNQSRNEPSLSVMLPVYNAAPFLRSALDSILDQDFRDFECIAIDGGSTDGSAAILDEYRERDLRLRVFHQPNAGYVERLNRGVALCRAPLIARMDADDICLPGRFRIQMQYFHDRNDLAVLGGQIQLIDAKGEPLRLIDYPAGGKELQAFLYKGSPVAHPAVMLRKAALEQVGLYREAFSFGEDYDLWLRIDEAGYAIENLKVPLIGYRQHGGNASVVQRRQQALATVAAQCAHRVRMLGLPDPTANLQEVDEQLFDRFPAEVISDFATELFVVLLGNVSFDSKAELIGALAAFKRQPKNLRRSERALAFLLQAGPCALKYRLYPSAAFCVVQAFSIEPAGVASILRKGVTRLGRRLASEAIHYVRKNLSSLRRLVR